MAFDLEKTAPGHYSGSICQWAFVVLKSPGAPAEQEPLEHSSLIKPDKDFSEWSPHCTDVHGITAAKVRAVNGGEVHDWVG